MAKSTIRPVRLTRSRAKGSKLVSPNGLPVVCCTRPGNWGNPFPTAGEFEFTVKAIRGLQPVYQTLIFEPAERRILWIILNIDQLRGKNLACWCKQPSPGQPDVCHGALLLELANAITERRQS